MALQITTDEPEGAEAGRILLLPGANYDVRQPGLFWPAQALRAQGWRLVVARWEAGDWGDDPHGFVADAAAQLADHEPRAAQTVVLGKSLGTLAASWSVEHGYRGIWLTPLLGDEAVRAALEGCDGHLLVGGTADPTWQLTDDLRRRHTIVEVPGMNHGLMVDTDWRRSLAALTTVLEAVEQWVGHLSPDGEDPLSPA